MINVALLVALIVILAMKLSIKTQIAMLFAIGVVILYFFTRIDMLPSLILLYAATPLLLLLKKSIYSTVSYGLVITAPVAVTFLLHFL